VGEVEVPAPTSPPTVDHGRRLATATTTGPTCLLTVGGHVASAPLVVLAVQVPPPASVLLVWTETNTVATGRELGSVLGMLPT